MSDNKYLEYKYGWIDPREHPPEEDETLSMYFYRLEALWEQQQPDLKQKVTKD